MCRGKAFRDSARVKTNAPESREKSRWMSRFADWVGERKSVYGGQATMACEACERTDDHMRTIGKLGGLAAVILAAQMATGCRMIEHHFGLIDAPAAEVSRPAKPRKVARLIKPKPVAAGQTLREFCGRRHVEFQAGRLSERPDEMARNNDLCRQLYTIEGPARQG